MGWIECSIRRLRPVSERLGSQVRIGLKVCTRWRRAGSSLHGRMAHCRGRRGINRSGSRRNSALRLRMRRSLMVKMSCLRAGSRVGDRHCDFLLRVPELSGGVHQGFFQEHNLCCVVSTFYFLLKQLHRIKCVSEDKTPG